MADPYVIVSLTLQGDPLLGDRPVSQIAGWFRSAVGGAISLPGVTCFELIGPEPQIVRTMQFGPDAFGMQLTAGWLARVRMDCFEAPRSAPTPDSPPRETPAEVAAAVATAMQSLRTALHQIVATSLVLGGAAHRLQVATAAYAPAAHGTVASWQTGERARTSPTQNAGSLWNQLTGAAAAVIGPNPIALPNALTSNLKSLAIWGGVIVGLVIFGPPLYSLVRSIPTPAPARTRRNPSRRRRR